MRVGLLGSIIFFWTTVLSAHCATAAANPTSLRSLIVLGLEKNIGLQVEQLNIPFRTEAIKVDESVFDSEVFASLGYSELKTPLASSLSLTDHSDSELLSGQVGLRKKYQSGFTTTLSLDTEWSEDDNQTEDLDPRYRSSLNLTLTQPLLRDFGVEANTTNLRVSRNQQRKSVLQHRYQAQNLALQIETLAGQLAGGAQIVLLRTEAVELSTELLAANQRRYDAGVIPISEVQEAETAAANRELELSLARQSRELLFDQLNQLLNHGLSTDFDPSSLFALGPDFPAIKLPEFEQMFAEAQVDSLVLQQNMFDIQNLSIRQDYYRNQLKPQLDLNLQAGVNGLSGDERSSSVNSRYAGSWGDSFSSAADSDGYQWGAGLEFSIPLGNRMAESRLRQAELQRKQANYRQRDLESQLRSALQQQAINLKRALEQVKIAERFEQLAKLSLDQEQRRLEEGLSDTFRMISFQDNMINAKIGRINALVQYYTSVAQINFTRGIILEQHNITLLLDTEEKSLETM